MQRATIKDVAREAGVSIATASNAMNNPDVVKEETREAVLRAAEKLSYVPNANGKRLRAKLAKTLGLFIVTMDGEFYELLANSMNQVCQARGYELQICLVSNVTSLMSRLTDRSMDGAVIFMDLVDEATVNKIIGLDYPLVFIAQEKQGEHVSSILFESEKTGRIAAEYLYGMGKRKILHMYGLQGNYDSKMRLKGFLDVLEGLGIPRQEVEVLEGKFARDASYQELRRYLQEKGEAPDAIFASNDLSAVGCYVALNEMGYRVPEDVSVLGCDDISLSEYLTPALTTIRTGFQEIGALAAEELIRLIQGNPGKIIQIDSRLVVRKSCQLSYPHRPRIAAQPEQSH